MKENITPDYSNVSTIPFLSRLIALIIDAAVVLILTIALSFASVSIFNNTSYYQSATQFMKNESQVCYQINEESHLITYNGEGDDHYSSQVPPNDVLKKTLYSHILLSYNTDPTYFHNMGVTALDIDPTIIPANDETDEIIYFYYHFVKEKNNEYSLLDLTDKSPEQYHYDLFRQYEAKDDNNNSMWVFDKIGDFPILKGEFAYDTYIYLKGDNVKPEYEVVFKKLNNQYVYMWNHEYEITCNSPVFQTHYNAYQNKYRECAGNIDWLFVLSYVIAFAIGYILPIFIFKRFTSLGKKIESIYIASSNGEDPKKIQIISRALLKIFPFFGFATASFFFISFFNSSWTYTIFYIGSLPISLMVFNILFLIVAFISLIVIMINKERRSIADLLCRTRLIDYSEYQINQKPKPSLTDNKTISKEDFVNIDLDTIEANHKNKHESQ